MHEKRLRTLKRFYYLVRQIKFTLVLILTFVVCLTFFTGIVAAAPPVPSNLTAAVMSGGQVKLQWNDNSSDESGFLIERATSDTAEVFISNKVSFQVRANSTTFVDNTVAARTTYYYRISALGVEGNSSPSNTAMVTTPDVLTFPKSAQDLMVKQESAAQVLLRWKDLSDNEEGFRIERAADEIFSLELKTFDINAGEVSFVDSAIEGQKTYFYRVYSWNANGDSLASNVVSLTTLPEVPEAPSDLVAGFIGDRQATLRWIDNSVTETGFQVERATDSNFQRDIAVFNVGANFGSRVSATVTDHQTPAVSFWYRVKAYNDSGDSEYSNVSNITVNDYANQDTLIFGNETVALAYPGFNLLSPASVTINRLAQAQEGSFTLNSADDKAQLQISAGTKMFNVNGHPLIEINYFVPDVFPQIPQGKTIIEGFNFGPNGATFSNKATLTLKYDPANFPRDVTYDELTVVCWNGSDWQNMDDLKFKPGEETLAVSMLHTGLVAVIGPKPDLSPKFSISNLNIFPQSASVGNSVQISLTVRNIGYSFGYNDVVLILNGAMEDTKWISLEPGQKTDVKFICADKPVGDYNLDINGTRGSFSIREASASSPSANPTTASASSAIPTYSPVTVPDEPAQFPILVVGLAAGLVVALIVVLVLLRR